MRKFNEKRSIMKYFILLLIVLSCGKQDRTGLLSKLEGDWETKAWDGKLIENWRLSEDGWPWQHTYYVENNDTSYSSQSKMEYLAGELILVTVIKNNPSYIFKASLITEDSIIFENSKFRNPNRVKYEFIDRNKLKRTIKGIENDSIVQTIFNFKRVE